MRDPLLECLQGEFESPDAPPPYTRLPDPKRERIVSIFSNPELAARHLREFIRAPLLSDFIASRIVKKHTYSFRRGVMRQMSYLGLGDHTSMDFLAKFSLISTTLDLFDHQQVGILLRTSHGEDPITRWMLHCTLPHPISPEHSASTLVKLSSSQFRLTLLFMPEPIELDWIRNNDAYELTRSSQSEPPIARLTLTDPKLHFHQTPSDSDALHFLLSAAHLLHHSRN